MIVAVYYYLFSSFKINSIHYGPYRVFLVIFLRYKLYWGRCCLLAVFFSCISQVGFLMLEIQIEILKDLDH